MVQGGPSSDPAVTGADVAVGNGAAVAWEEWELQPTSTIEAAAASVLIREEELIIGPSLASPHSVMATQETGSGFVSGFEICCRPREERTTHALPSGGMSRLNSPALVAPLAGLALFVLASGCAPAGHASGTAARRQQVAAEAATTPVIPLGHELTTDDGSPAGTIEVQRLAFAPSSFTITAGQSLLWRFDDGGVAHTVTGGGVDSGPRTTGLFSHTFASPGTFRYHCSVHPGMEGTVVVTGR